MVVLFGFFAKRRFVQLKKRLGSEVCKTLGTHIASGQIQEDDGVNSLADNNGHFTHHPSGNFKYYRNLNIVKSLK